MLVHCCGAPSPQNDARYLEVDDTGVGVVGVGVVGVGVVGVGVVGVGVVGVGVVGVGLARQLTNVAETSPVKFAFE